MIELRQDLWTVEADAIVITTNGFVKQNGECVMGRGCAREARDRFPGIARNLGYWIKRNGNHVAVIWQSPKIVSFPVKHHWAEEADLALIERSTKELVALCNGEYAHWKRIATPRPGCGNGRLSWEDVRPILKGWLDDRFIVVSK